MMITKPQLAKCIPHATQANIDKFYEPLCSAMTKYEINTNRRIAAFLPSIAVESDSLFSIEENLNYSAKRLLEIFPSYFTPEEAQQYANKPEMIANRVYANRMGNGPYSYGDGWKHRGFGLIMITGAENQKKATIAIGQDLRTIPGACLSAAWFWSENGLNRLADIDAFEKISIAINGKNKKTGRPNGIIERIAAWEIAKKALNVV